MPVNNSRTYILYIILTILIMFVYIQYINEDMNRNKNKKVVCPMNYLKQYSPFNHINKNYYPPEWISIDNKFRLFSIRCVEIFVNFRFVGNFICVKQESLNCPLRNFSVIG